MALDVNGTPISDAAIDAEVNRLRQRMSPEERKQMEARPPQLRELQLAETAKTHLVERELLRQEAARRTDITVDPDTVEASFEAVRKRRYPDDGSGETPDDEALARLRRDVETNERVRALLDAVVAAAELPGEAEARAHYEAHPEQFRRPEQVDASHIVAHASEDDSDAVAKAKAKIDEAAAALADGTAFADAVARYSDCADDQSGHLGAFPRGHMVQRFEDVVFAMTPDTVSAPFQTEFGWHIAWVHAHEPEGLVEFDSVKDGILESLRNRARDKACESFVDGLREAAEIRETDKAPVSGP